MASGVIYQIKRHALHDGPGIRTTVFLKGCPLQCWWCHNPESQAFTPQVMHYEDRCIGCGKCLKVCEVQAQAHTCQDCGACVKVCPTEAKEQVGRHIGVQELMMELRKDLLFYEQSSGGITFSGGEPLSQCNFLLAMLQQCRREGIHCAVDTSGFAKREVIEQILPYTDLFLYDLKHLDPIKHRQYTGVDNQQILANLRLLAGAGANLRIRVPIIPTVNDDYQHIRQLGGFIASLPGRSTVDILPYHPSATAKYRKLGLDYHLDNIEAPSVERMESIAGWLRELDLSVKIGG